MAVAVAEVPTTDAEAEALVAAEVDALVVAPTAALESNSPAE